MPFRWERKSVYDDGFYMKKQRFIITAFALSSPETMGGNSKICLEMMRYLSLNFEVHVVVPNDRVLTIEKTLGDLSNLHIHSVPNFGKSEFIHFFECVRYYTSSLERIFNELKVGDDDIVYSCSDFHVDTLPCLKLKKRFGYKWIAVQFLFVPSLWENLVKGYKFPAIKYILVWVYSYLLFYLARSRADAFVITNDSDRNHFSKSFQKKIFPFYGGVNVDQIPAGRRSPRWDVVFCSRLHPQKGIDGFLDVWKIVHEKKPNVRFGIIGNGDKRYEDYLKDKAKRLGITDSIDWLGYVNNEAKYEIYASSKVMVHPTVFDNNGMVAAEALCSGLPVVMYDLKPLRELYTEGCIKIPFGDKAAFAEAIIKLLDDKAMREGIAPSGEILERLRNRWDWANRVAAFRSWLEGCGLWN
jgi:glycosyltransferase involved in cell wall biosynthesis